MVSGNTLRPKKKYLCFGQPDRTYRIRPTLEFFYENTVFFVGVFIIEVSIFELTLPKVFKTVALNTRFIFLALFFVRPTGYYIENILALFGINVQFVIIRKLSIFYICKK